MAWDDFTTPWAGGGNVPSYPGGPNDSGGGFFGNLLDWAGDNWQVLADVGSGLGAGYLGYLGQTGANEINRDIAREQMAFQERMSNSAVERRMRDLRRSGINPLLAASREASSPAGSATTVGSALGAGIQAGTSAVSSALSVKRHRQELKNMAAQVKDIEAATKQKVSASGLNEAQARTAAAQENAAREQAAYTATQNELARYQIPGAKNEADFERTLGPKARELRRLIQSGIDRNVAALIVAGKFITEGKGDGTEPGKPRNKITGKKPKVTKSETQEWRQRQGFGR